MASAVQFHLKFDTTIEDRFEIWCAENPEIVNRIRSMALSLRRNGHERWGMKALFEVVRYETALRERSGSGFKINNDFTALLARKLMKDHPELEGFFETRKRKA